MMVTFGQYGFLWGFRLAGEANAWLDGKVLRVKTHTRIFLVGYVICMAAFFGLMFLAFGSRKIDPGYEETISNWVFALAIGLSAYFLWLLVMVARMLRRISGRSAPRSGLVVLLFFFLGSALPLLQSCMNKTVLALRQQI